MQNVKVVWVLPTTRESGRPLAVEDISHVRIELSADGGQSYARIDDFTPDVLETTVEALDVGTWTFRGLVADKQGRVSAPVIASVEIVPPGDTTAPSPLVTLVLNLV
jgi:hypothetical protein